MSEIVCQIEGVDYAGWKGMDFNAGLDTLAPSFTLETTSDTVADKRIMVGQSAKLIIDGELICSGFIDDKTFEDSAEDISTSVVCRSILGDLVDCSAIQGTGQWKNRTAKQIIEELIKPFKGITVEDLTHSTKKFRSFSQEPGEAVFEAIDRLCRMRGLLPTAGAAGAKIVLRNQTPIKVKWEFEYGRNVKKFGGKLSTADRFRDYIVRGQAAGGSGLTGKTASQIEGRAKDPAITRYRPKLIMSESGEDAGTLKERALWEARTREHRANRPTITVNDYGNPGDVYKAGDYAQLVHAERGINGVFMICAVNLKKTVQDGEQSVITLTMPDAYSVLKLPEDEPTERVWAK